MKISNKELETISSIELDHYKDFLKSYRYCKQKITECEDKLLELRVEHEHLHSIRYDKVAVQGSSDSLMSALHEHDLRELISYWEDELLKNQQNIEEIEHDLRTIDIKMALSIKKIFCLKCSTLGIEGYHIGYSRDQMKRNINRCLREIIYIKKHAPRGAKKEDTIIE